MISLDDFQINSKGNGLKEDDLKFLNLSGRKTFHSQGYLGQGVIVAVVDTGVNKHTELEGRILKGKNFCYYGGEHGTKDDHGHGTHVAGSIAGLNVGIAPKAEILPVKVLDALGGCEIEDIIKALKWIKEYTHKDGRKVSIVSMSLSFDKYSESKKDIDELHKTIQELVNVDIAVICSSGNTAKREIRYPAGFDEVICVGAVDIEKEKALFSTMGKHVDVCQVGVNVISCDYEQQYGGEYDYAVMSGTSMSTPLVSGIAALIACKYKEQFNRPITEQFLWELLKFNTKDIGVKGLDKNYGAGFCTLQPLEADIIVTEDSNILYLNGQKIEMNTPAKVINGRFMLPVRFMAQSTGSFISYNSDTDTGRFIY